MYSVAGIGCPTEIRDNSLMRIRFKELLEYKDVTQTQAAFDLGVNQGTISKWISGENSPPTKKLEELASYFGVDPIFLFERYPWDGPHRKIIERIPSLDERDAKIVSNLIDDLTA